MQNTTHEMVDVAGLASILNLSQHTIRDWLKQRPPRGPRPIKLSPSRQGRLRFTIEEVRRWQTDPHGYERQHCGATYDRR